MIEANGVIKSYGLGGSKTDVLKGIDLQISDGDFAVILGASGSGKSTLLNCLSGLERVDGGSIEYDGLNIAELSDKALTKFRKENIGFMWRTTHIGQRQTRKPKRKTNLDKSKVVECCLSIGSKEFVNFLFSS